MSIFVEKSLFKFNPDVLCLFSCHYKLPYAAAVTHESQSTVYFFQENKLMDGLPWNCTSKLLSMAWHPDETVLVLGSDTGELFSISWEKEIQKERKFPLVHKHAVKYMSWANDTQFISLDTSGSFILWNCNGERNFLQTNVQEIKDTPVQMAFMTESPVWECYIGCLSGIIYHITQEKDTCSQVLHTTVPIKEIITFQDYLCVLTNGGLLSVYQKNQDTSEGGLELLNSVRLANFDMITVKMSGKSSNITVIWLDEGLLAICGSDLLIRLWNCESNDTSVLPLPENSEISFHSTAEHFTWLAFRNNILAATTNLGGVAFWRRDITTVITEEDQWQFAGFVSFPGGSVLRSSWGVASLYVYNSSNLYEIRRQIPCAAFKNQVGAIQLSSSIMSIHKEKNCVQLDVPSKIVGADMFDNHLLIWGESNIFIYQLGPSLTHTKPVVVGSFECSCSLSLLHKTTCFCLERSVIQMRSFQGTILSTLSFMDVEGHPTLLSVSANFLCAASINGFIKLWDIKQRDPKLHVGTKHVATDVPNFVKLHSINCNADGSCVSFTAHSEKSALSALYVWRTASNRIERFELEQEFQNGSIDTHCWDDDEPRFIVCQISTDAHTTSLISIFIPMNENLLVQDTVSIQPYQSLIGVNIPKLTLLDQSVQIETILLESLTSLEEHNDKATRDALLSFSCHLRQGYVQQAYQVVQFLKSPGVWQSLAQSCVKMKRPDVGLICLGKLGDARAAQAVRQAKSRYNDVDAVTAVLAVQVGMMEEAEMLCQKSACYDLLNRMYQASNQWDKALQLASTKDHVNLKRTFYDYARHLENQGDIQTAKEMFEKCQTHHFDVPRILFEDPPALEHYCTSTDDPDRLRWWAQFLESSGNIDSALEFYSKAGDHLSLVRLHSYLGDLDRATKIAEESQNAAACFHVARQHEAANNITEALKFFGISGAYGNAVRLCKEHELDDQLYRYALQGDHEEMIEAARYFEAIPATMDRQTHFDRAVILYSKAGLLDTALDLASRTGQHEAILELSRRLDRNSNPASLQRCANYLAANRHYDAAVDLLAMAGKFSEAIEMCLEYNVELTETLADQLCSSEANDQLLTQLAEVAQRQGHYQLAAKKFTQAGNKIQAMKALLKSGDTERIIFFTNVSRQADIFILAGNYLQTLDWRSNPEYVKHIVTFYTKAKAPEMLRGFYDACAQAEIDEYQNYESALNALKEAQKIQSNVSSSVQSDMIEARIAFLEKFINLKEMANLNPVEGVVQLEALLEAPDFQLGGLKAGNIYSSIFNIQLHHDLNEEALQTLKSMSVIVPNFMQYLDRESVSTLCHNMGQSPNAFFNHSSESNNEND